MSEHRPVIDFPERFLSKFAEDENGCWIWAACAQRYPVFQWEGKKRYAHRLAWEWVNGEIPARHHVHHDCGTPLCVNPSHLEVHSPEDHYRKHGARGRARINAKKTHCQRGHKFDAENTYVYGEQAAQRKCRKCRAEAARRFRARGAAA